MHIIIMILLISILIIVHEAGHFLAARFFNIKVEKFAIGLPFGPTLYEKQFGETTFLIHACLFGGYISFPDDNKENNLPNDSVDLFNNRPTYQKIIVVSAGVFANVLCALGLVLFTAFVWGKLPLGEAEISINTIVGDKNATVWQSGLQKDDVLYSINGVKLTSFYELGKMTQFSRTHDGATSNNIIAQNLKQIYNLNNLRENFNAGDKIFLPKPIAEEPLTVTKKQVIGLEKMPVEDVKLSEQEVKLRDEIQGKDFFVAKADIDAQTIATAISDTYKPLNIVVVRNGKQVELTNVIADKDGLIGFVPNVKELYSPTTGIKSGIINSCKYLKLNTEMMILGLGSICTGKIPLKDLHGIVAIAKVGGTVIEHQGMFKGLLLTAIISLNLAIVNFLPLPALDGGHVCFMCLEKITGKKFDEKTLDKISSFGFYFLLLLMVVVLFNDIWALITKAI